MRKSIFLFFLLSAFTFSTFAQDAPAADATATAPADQGAGNNGNNGNGSSTASGDEYNIVDFSKIHNLGDYDLLQDDKAGKKLAGYNLPDFTNLPANLYSADDLKKMNINLKLHNWLVTLSKSSVTTEVLNNSAVRAVDSKAKGTVLGVRTVFPNGQVNSIATVAPPFIIPSSFGVKPGSTSSQSTNSDETQGTDYGFGILHNVGVIRSVSLETYGRLFPYKVSVVFERSNGEELEIVLGDLNFEGWRTLVWNNNNYIQDVRFKERNPQPLYPNSAPWLRFKEIKFYKNAEQKGGDFVAYVGKINVVYDKAYTVTEDADIKDEDFWFIDKRNSMVEKYKEISRIAQKSYNDINVTTGTYKGNNNPVDRTGDNGNPNGATDDNVQSNGNGGLQTPNSSNSQGGAAGGNNAQGGAAPAPAADANAAPAPAAQ